MVLEMVRKITRMVVGFDLSFLSTRTHKASRLRTVPKTAMTLEMIPPKKKWLAGSMIFTFPSSDLVSRIWTTSYRQECDPRLVVAKAIAAVEHDRGPTEVGDRASKHFL